MNRLIAACGCAIAWAFGATGCSTPAPADYTPTQARLYLESTDGRAPTVKLPRSGVVIAVSSKAVMTEADIVNAEVVQVDLGRCLMLQVTPTAARDLYRLTGANQGKRLVLTLNDVALGARQIEAPMAEGGVMIFVEMTDGALDDLVRDLKRTSAEVQRQISRKS
jgi:hypothetical protein